MKNLLKEPLLHFLVIGAMLFFLFDWRGNDASVPAGLAAMPTAQILVPLDTIDQMNSLFVKTWQRLLDGTVGCVLAAIHNAISQKYCL